MGGIHYHYSVIYQFNPSKLSSMSVNSSTKSHRSPPLTPPPTNEERTVL